LDEFTEDLCRAFADPHDRATARDLVMRWAPQFAAERRLVDAMAKTPGYRMLGVGEAAAQVGRSTKTLHRAIVAGELKVSRPHARRIEIRFDELLRWAGKKYGNVHTLSIRPIPQVPRIA
jgi:hypothetical protein